MSEKLGKAGRFYSLTPKAYEFIEALEKWCADRGIKPEEIPKFLEGVVSKSRDLEYEMKSWNQKYKELVEKGYLKEEEAEAVDKHLVTECSAQEFKDYMRENGLNIDLISDRTLNDENSKFRHRIRRAFLLDLRAKKEVEA